MATNTTLVGNDPYKVSAAWSAPLLIGTLFNWLLFGVLSVQTYIYYLGFPDDSRRNKALVYGIYSVEIVQTALTGADAYFWYATGLENPTHIGNVNISPADIPLLCGIIAGIVHLFFAFRIYTLRRSFLWLSISIVLASFVQAAGAVGATIRGFKLQEYSRFHENMYFPQSFNVWLISDAVCDFLIAGTMLWLYFISRKDGDQSSGS